MKKIETLTKQQEKKMITVRDEWLNRFFSCKKRTNKTQARKSINWLYEFSGLKKPLIIFLDSPLGIQYGANMLKSIGGNQVENQVRNQVWSQVENQVWSQVWSQVGNQVGNQVENQVWNQVRSQVRNQVWSQVGNQVRNQVWSQVGNQVWNQVGNQVWNQVRNQVWNQVRNQVWSQVGNQVRNQVWSQVGSEKLEYFPFSSYGSVWDYGWVAFYEYFQSIGVKYPKKLLENFNNFSFLLKSNIYDMIQLEGVCLVSNMPIVIKRDSLNRLHSEDSPAIEFADGYKDYYYHGIAVPEKWITNPEKLTKKDWSNESNLEKRRVIQELMGDDFPKKLKAKLIDKPSKEFKKHNLLGLYEVELKDDPEKIARYVKVKDHSSKRMYYLRVKPTIDDADEALAFTFNMTKEQYMPVQEA